MQNANAMAFLGQRAWHVFGLFDFHNKLKLIEIEALYNTAIQASYNGNVRSHCFYCKQISNSFSTRLRRHRNKSWIILSPHSLSLSFLFIYLFHCMALSSTNSSKHLENKPRLISKYVESSSTRMQTQMINYILFQFQMNTDKPFQFIEKSS